MAPKKKMSVSEGSGSQRASATAASSGPAPKAGAKKKKAAAGKKKAKKVPKEGATEGAAEESTEPAVDGDEEEEEEEDAPAEGDEAAAAPVDVAAEGEVPSPVPEVAAAPAAAPGSDPPKHPLVPRLPQKAPPGPKDKGNLYAPGEKVWVKRSSGEEVIGFVEKFEASTKVYKVALEAIGSGQFKLVPEANMRTYDGPDAGAPAAAAGAPEAATGSKIDVSDVAAALPNFQVPGKKNPSIPLDLGKMKEGEHDLKGAGDFLTTARAENEVPITVRGPAKMKAKRFLMLKPEHLGSSRVQADWRPNMNERSQLAVASHKDGVCLLHLYTRKSPKPVAVHNLGEGQPVWLGWDAKGECLAVLLEGVGLFLWDVPADLANGTPTQPLRLAPNITKDASYCSWSKMYPQLAIGTNLGKVIIFNKQRSLMQLHERKGKHGAPVTCGDWLQDNRLGLASGARVKISKPLSEDDAQWESYSKFKLTGMLSRVPKKFKEAGAPRFLSFSKSNPPFVAVCIGDNYMLVFGTQNGANEDLGLTFPDDYGPVAGFEWMEDDVVLVSLANGYVTSVDFGAMVRMRQETGLPEAVKATGTTKVFADYLKCLTYSPATKRIACVGDKGVKVITRKKGIDGKPTNELEVLVDHTLDYELSIGNCLETCKWDDSGNTLLITSTDGYVWCFDFSNV